MVRKASSKPSAPPTASIGFEAKLWLAATPPDIARHFDEPTAPLMAIIKANSTEYRTLATLRDTLLPNFGQHAIYLDLVKQQESKSGDDSSEA
jgi:hypothetical protein